MVKINFIAAQLGSCTRQDHYTNCVNVLQDARCTGHRNNTLVELHIHTQSSSDHYVVVEGLEKSREPLPHMEAIYIISPTDSVSVVLMCM